MTRAALLFSCCVAACGGRSVQTIDVTSSGSSLAGAGGAEAGTGSSNRTAGAGGVDGTAGLAWGGGAGGSKGGAAGSANASGGASAGAGCVTADQCPAPVSRCASAICDNGVCATAFVAGGALALRDSPADCSDTVCDGRGATVNVVDVDNVPAPLNPCSSVSCSSLGATESTPVKAGADCSGSAGAKLCDGAGHCVECLGDADCQPSETCVQNSCVSASCSDGFKDSDETDIDCGGGCAPCAITKDCVSDADCASAACDVLVPHRCLADQCADHHKDGAETGVDCGGPTCAKCGDFGGCKVNLDCAAGYCDADRGWFCEPARCLDGVLDGSETDLDCGGGICDGCALGQKCELYFDCASGACDGISLTCVADHCTDHNWDGDETYIDCGGSCAPCAVGQLCATNADCQPGLACAPGNPHVCR